MSDQHEMVRPYAVGAHSESNAKHNESGELLTESWMRVYQNMKVHHSPNSCLSTFGCVASVISRKLKIFCSRIVCTVIKLHGTRIQVVFHSKQRVNK